MATIKLSDLPSGQIPSGPETLPMLQGGQTVAVSVTQLRSSPDGANGVSSGNAKDMDFTTGVGADHFGHGGRVNFRLGHGTNTEGPGYGGLGGNFNIYAGNSYQAEGYGGYFYVKTGDNSAIAGNGGNIWLYAGSGLNDYGSGGTITLKAGEGYYGGDVKIQSGEGSGEGFETSAGEVMISGGYAFQYGGPVLIYGGRGATIGPPYTQGGRINIVGGTAYYGGEVYIYSGRGYGGAGGNISVIAGGNRGDQNGGDVVIRSGYTYTGRAGNISIYCGDKREGSPGQIYMSGLPTGDPGQYGALWCDTENANVIKMSRPG